MTIDFQNVPIADAVTAAVELLGVAAAIIYALFKKPLTKLRRILSRSQTRFMIVSPNALPYNKLSKHHIEPFGRSAVIVSGPGLSAEYLATILVNHDVKIIPMTLD